MKITENFISLKTFIYRNNAFGKTLIKNKLDNYYYTVLPWNISYCEYNNHYVWLFSSFYL